MPKNITIKTKAKKNKGSSTPGSGKELGLSLTNKLGKSLISGLVPVLVGAVAKAATLALPGPQLNNSLSVSAPAARGTTVKSGNPRMTTSNNGNVVVKHREFIADVVANTTGFDLQFQFGMNPGNPALAPWLSQLATRFDCYKFRNFCLSYEPQTSSTTTGTVMIAADYDASDPPPTSKVEMMSYKSSVRSVPWSPCHMVSSSADLHRLKTNFVLMGTPPPDSDIKTFDIGNLYVAVITDATPGTFLGELYFSYDVELLTPQITNEVPSVSIYSNPPGSIPALGESGQIFGTSPVLQGPLPVLTESVAAVSPETEGSFNITIQIPGYYIINVSSFHIVATELFISNNPAIAVKYDYNSAYDEDQQSFQGSAIIQVVDPSQDQITFNYQTADSEASCYVNITPFSSSSLPNSNLTGPLVIENNLRMRLGRRKIRS